MLLQLDNLRGFKLIESKKNKERNQEPILLN